MLQYMNSLFLVFGFSVTIILMHGQSSFKKMVVCSC
uniref:Uncharacterized protein n=1 Tax=Manihot esculenta TaxID=3983 RepID=A0A2C9W098_MANES